MEAMEVKDAASSAREKLQMTLQFAPMFAKGTMQKTMRRMHKDLERIHEMEQMNYIEVDQPTTLQEDAKVAIKLYQALLKAGIVMPEGAEPIDFNALGN